MKRLHDISLLVATIFAVLFSNASNARADRSGIIGRTVTGCGNCHSASPDIATAVSHNLAGNTITVAPGNTADITAYVAHATLPTAGINISVKDTDGANAGTFTAGAGLRLESGELTHNIPQAITGIPRRAQFLFQWTAPTTPGTYTLRMAGLAADNNNAQTGDVWNFLSEPVTIIVPGIQAVSPNGNEQWCRGSTHAIKWNSYGISQVIIELSQDLGQNWSIIAGPVSAASGQWIWNIPAALPSGGAYLIRISNVANRAVNDASNSPFFISVAPEITKQPDSSVSVCVGEKARFSVGVIENPAYFTYQWRKNGQDIPNALSYAYETPPSEAGSSDGIYDVIVSGCGSSIISKPSKLTVNTTPKITKQPSDVYVCEGESASFSVSGGGNITKYEWRKNGKPLANSNIATIKIASVSAKDTGSYEVVATGICAPPAISKTVYLRFLPAPRLLAGLHDTSVCEGAQLTLGVEPLDDSIRYEWRKDAEIIAGATQKTLKITALNSKTAGNYSLTMFNRCGVTSKTEAKISVAKPPEILRQTADTAVPASEPLTLSVLATGDRVSFQWKKDGKNRINDTLPTLFLQSVLPADTGVYQCVVSNDCGEKTVSIRIGLNGSSGPLLTFGALPFDFGCVRPGQFRDFTFPNIIRNDGGTTLTISSVEIIGENSTDFSVIEGGGTYQIATGATATLKVRFAPSSVGPKHAQIVFTSNSTSGTERTLDIFGRGCQTCVSIQRIVFDSIGVGETKDSTILICNICDVPFVGQKLDTATDGQFRLIAHEQVPKTLQPGNCLSATVRYAPRTNGEATGYIRLTSGAESHLVELVSTRKIITGVQEKLSFTGISVWPNPSTNIVKIHAEGATSVKITDIFGREIICFNRSAMNNGEILWNGLAADGSICAAGAYLVVAAADSDVRIAPLIIAQ
ncbi:hypothetical protein MASR2M18_14550 [Ignavibacteria bacterium]